MAIDLIPAIDIRDGKVVRLLRGDYMHQTTYDVDPVDLAVRFADAGCRWLHLVDLDGARDGRPANLELIEKIIHSAKLNVELGGGIRSEEVMEYLLAIGTQRLILSTRAISDAEWFKTMVHDQRFRGRLVLGLDARNGRASTHGWTTGVSDNPTAEQIVQSVRDWPLAAVIYTDISRDGTLAGPNIAATKELLRHTGKMPLIHSGGVAKLEDIIALKSLPIAGIIVGRAIYEGTLDVKQAVAELI
ncbi:MAG TPA: 1-(5-phosphoribosyl)-5-[(5-phosphoribosylamino)methylideneamino]imidazole-4-carboxamide isomerase [Phycisphaerae bacterium]|nr:1-(5-phosphoribosyl)-5-[(5-phosphoribosylamino)methylideneamino]imidazole-4-carboxamide isomerase [Phycisphaerae bacterium]